MSAGRLRQISVNPKGGVPKLGVPATRIHAGGVEGDRQRDLRFHGGPDRAVCLFAMEKIEKLRAEGHPIRPGSTGENLTVEGLDWDALRPGDVLEVGDEVVLELASYTTPCKNIRGSFKGEDFTRLSHKLHPGDTRVYARVLREGVVHQGDAVRLRPREHSSLDG